MFSSSELTRHLRALGEQLEYLGGGPFDLLVIGGTALSLLGLVRRTTEDVDVVAILDRDDAGVLFIREERELPEVLVTAARSVAQDLKLPEDWLNTGPIDLLEFGLPEGILSRTTPRAFGQQLTLHLCSSRDQTFFKLFATVDGGRASVHLSDLKQLEPTDESILAAARWCQTHDPSEGFRMVLSSFLRQAGYEHLVDHI